MRAYTTACGWRAEEERQALIKLKSKQGRKGCGALEEMGHHKGVRVHVCLVSVLLRHVPVCFPHQNIMYVCVKGDRGELEKVEEEEEKPKTA